MTGLKKALRSRRGFTLVELIVVLVIMGVLGTVTVPALTGYIDSSKEKQAVSETQACVETVTRIAAQKYAAWQQATVSGTNKNAQPLMDWAGTTADKAPDVSGGDVALTEGTGCYLLHVTNPPSGGIMTRDVAKDAGVSGHVTTFTCNQNGQVLYLVYTSADGITVVYTNVGTNSSVSNGGIEKVDVPKPAENNPKPDPEPNPEPGVKKLSVTFYKRDKATNDNISNAKMKVISGTTFTESWTTDGSAHTVQLPAGDYIYQEFTAPDGYKIADNISFSITENNGVLQLSGDNHYVNATNNTVTMYDEKSTTDDGGTTVKPSNKQLIIHLQDVSTGDSTPFANKKYHIESGENSFDVTSDANGDILVDISTYNKHLPNTIISGQRTVITEYAVPLGYQIIPAYSCIYISTNEKWEKGEVVDYYLTSISDNGNYNSGIVDMSKNQITIMRFPVGNMKLRVTDKDNVPLSNAIFSISEGTKTVATLTCDEKGECSIPVKLHEGDNIGDSTYLEIGKTYTINETYAPAGYQGGITSTFTLYHVAYPSNPQPESKTWFYINSYNGSHGEWGEYTTEKSVGDKDTFHVINTKRTLCTVYIRKIDDAGNPVQNAGLLLKASGNDILEDINNGSGYLVTEKSFTTTSATAVYELRQGKSYTISENSVPNGYVQADDLTFTVETGTTSKEITIIDHKNEENSNIKLDNIHFNDANNWAHKLTHDSKISFNGGEILCWKGVTYFNYDKEDNKTFNLSNDKKDTYSKNSTELNNAPDPMTFLQQHLFGTSSADNYIVVLTGKVYNYDSKNVTLKKGDIIVPTDFGDGTPTDGKNKKVYVYIGDNDMNLSAINKLENKYPLTSMERKLNKDKKTYNFDIVQ